MSINLTNSKVQEFESEVKQAYQQTAEILTNAVSAAGARVRRNVVGETVSFPRMNRAFMKPRGAFQSEITPENVEHYRIVLNLDNRVMLEYTDVFAQAEVNFDEMQEIAKLFAKALARDKDQAVIDALVAGTYVAAPTLNTEGLLINDGGTPAAMTVDKLKKAAAYMNGLGVPQEGRVLVIDAQSHEQLMNDDEFINSDYNAIRALNNGGMVNEYVGFRIVLMPDAYDSDGVKQIGLPLDGNIRKCYALHGESLAIAYGDVLDQLHIEWENKRASHSILAKLRRGSKIIDNQGVVEIQNDISL